MTRHDKIARMKPEQENHWINIPELSYWGERIFAEISVAEELNDAANGAYTPLIEQAVDCLYDVFTSEHALPDSVCKKAEQILLPLSEKAKSFRVHCVAHAHIDMNWKWGMHETVDVVLNTFRTMLDLMDEYPDFTFSQSQCAVYRLTELYDPALFARLKQRVEEGRFEFAGSSYVELDKNMPNLESMARHILYTKSYLRDTFGIPFESVNQDFHPDSFGHSASIPEILNAGGVRYFYHCRGLDGIQLYRWRGPSGAELLTINEPLWYNDSFKPMYLNLLVQVCQKYGITDAMKIYGVGDHGGGPTRKDIERILDMQSWPIAPTIFFSTYAAYFAAIEPFRENFPILTGELGPTHSGCYTSQSKGKLANRIAEDRLYLAEALTAFAAEELGMPDFNEQFRFAWEKVLFNQFHDILPGSNTPESREHAWGNFEDAMGSVMAASSASLRAFADAIDTSMFETPFDPLNSLAEGGGVGSNTDAPHRYRLPGTEHGRGKTRLIHLFNPTRFDRRGVQEITLWDWPGNVKQLRAFDEAGNSLPVQIIKDATEGWGHQRTDLLLQVTVPAFGYCTVKITEEEKQDFCFSALPPDPRVTLYPILVMENDLVKLTFSQCDYTLLSYVEKSTGKNLLGDAGARFLIQPERLFKKGGNAWEEGAFGNPIDLHRDGKPVLKELHLTPGLRQSIVYELCYHQSKLTVTVSLNAGSPVAEFDVDCAWTELPSLENGVPRLSFCAALPKAPERFYSDIQIGLLEREHEDLHDRCSRDFFFAPDGAGAGLALLTDSKYGYRGSGDTIQVALLRSSTEPDPYPEMGKRFFRVGLSMAKDDAFALKELGASFAHRDLPYCSNTAHPGTLPLSQRFFTLDGDAVATTVKLAEDHDGLILRLANAYADRASAVTVHVPGLRHAALLDLAEQPLQDCPVDAQSVSLTLQPGGCATLRLIRK